MSSAAILFGLDDRYVHPFLVALTSLAVTGGITRENAEIRVLHCGLSDRSCARISVVAERLEVSVALVGLEPQPDQYPVTDWVSAAAYHRLRLGEAVGDHSRVVYLDCDLIAMDRVDDLLLLEPEEPIAAVRDLANPVFGCGTAVPGYEELGIPATREYFNTGVMVIDVDAWQQEEVAERARTFLVEHPEQIRFWDQDALNVIIGERWQRLPLELNAFALSPLMPQVADEYRGADILPLDEALAIEERARILHFAGPFKPWRKGFPAGVALDRYQAYESKLRALGASSGKRGR